MVSPQGAARLLDLRTLITAVVAVSQMRDTISLSETFTRPTPQQRIVHRNVAQPSRDTDITNLENASESPAEASNEALSTTISDGDVYAADVGTTGSTNSLPSSPVGHQISAHRLRGRIDPR